VALATDRLVRPVEGMHRTISRRWFDAIGPVATPVRAVHDAIAGTVYSAIRVAGTLVGFGLDAGVTIRDETADGLAAFVTGVLGEDLDPHGQAFDVPMEVRSVGEPPTDRIVVLVHGLTETERIFDGDDGLRAAIDDDPTLTGVTVRYHSGLPIDENGARLADVLDALVADWPVPVGSVAIVGRSMGGLVARGAATAGLEANMPWARLLTDVVTLGTPHRGSYVARFADLAARGLRVAPDTRPLADVLEARSAGIRDLERGSAADLPEGIAHHFVAGVVTAAPGIVGTLVGDTLVGPRSAIGQGLRPTTTVTVPTTAHGTLHRHPDVVAAVMAWLAPDGTTLADS